MRRRLIGKLIVYTCMRRPSVVHRLSILSNRFSEALRPILFILHIYHLQEGGREQLMCFFDRITTPLTHNEKSGKLVNSVVTPRIFDFYLTAEQ